MKNHGKTMGRAFEIPTFPLLSPVLQDLDEEVSRIADQRGTEKTGPAGPAKAAAHAAHASPSPVPATSPVPETGGTPTPNVEERSSGPVVKTIDIYLITNGYFWDIYCYLWFIPPITNG